MELRRHGTDFIRIHMYLSKGGQKGLCDMISLTDIFGYRYVRRQASLRASWY